MVYLQIVFLGVVFNKRPFNSTMRTQMDKVEHANNFRPGKKALSLVDHVLHGTLYTDTLEEFTCIISKFQTVEIESDPGWMSDETGKLVQVIAIEAPDTEGNLRSIGIETQLLMVASNDN